MSMSGKKVLITGATSGIGEEAAVALAKLGAQVFVHGRSEDKIERVLARIRQEAGRQDAQPFVCDLSSMEDIRQQAQALEQRLDKLDVLLNNAGAVHQSRKLTPDGLEMTFGVNHLSYYMMALLLWPALRRSAPGARLVNVASDAHRGARIDWDDLQGERSWSSMRFYCDSKLMNILMTRELARRAQGQGVTVNALHPGVVATGFARNDPGLVARLTGLFAPLLASPARGARTSVWACSSPEAASHHGLYFASCKVQTPSRAALDDQAAARLWSVSQSLTGLTL